MKLINKITKRVEKKYEIDEKEKWETKAEKYLKDLDKANLLIKKAELKAEAKKKGPIRTFFENIVLLIDLFKSYIKGEYKKIPYGSMLMITASIVYFVVPIDIIPDFIVSLGFIDDAAIIGLIMKQIESDLEKYRQWKVERDLTYDFMSKKDFDKSINNKDENE